MELEQDYSQKLYRIVYLKNYLVKKIDENQTIKRLCRYMTTTPLLNKGYSYDHRLIQQPDLVDSLLEPVVHDTQVSIKDPTLVPYAFSESVLNDRKLSIYVHCPYSSFSPNGSTGRSSLNGADVTGRHKFMIEIIYPIEYDRLEPFGEERANLIGCEILNLIDGQYVDEETRKKVGECQFRVQGEITNLRLSTSGYMVLSIPVLTSVIGLRTLSDEED